MKTKIKRYEQQLTRTLRKVNTKIFPEALVLLKCNANAAQKYTSFVNCKISIQHCCEINCFGVTRHDKTARLFIYFS